MSFNPWYLLLILTALGAWGVQALVRKAYQKYEVVPNRSGTTGLVAARSLLVHNGLYGVGVEQAQGTFTDHYNPQTRTLHLSHDILNGTSVTALGIVAHEVGHAAQHAEGYRFIELRTKLAGPVGWLARLSPLVFVGGFMYGITALMALGGLMLLSQVIFALVTLPVEWDASRRASAMLEKTGMVEPAEREGIDRVLRSAGLTYLTSFGRRLASFVFFAVVLGAAGLGVRI